MTGAFAWAVTRLRFVIVPLWVAAAIFVALQTTTFGSPTEGAFGGLVPSGARAVAVERHEFELFGSTLSSRIAVVQRRQEGFRPGEQQRVFERALRIARREQPLLRSIAFALPITNGRGFFPSSSERDTTAITFLYYRPDVSLNAQLALADTYATRIANRGDALVGVTGSLPARDAEFEAIQAALPWVTAATIALIAIILLLVYRALAPPLIALGAAGIVYVLATSALGRFAEWRGTAVPQEVEPVMVALLLGLVTDYAVFFLSGTRRRLLAGDAPLDATALATRLFAPIILTAGLIVAAGAATLVVGRLPVFRAFGPGLALTVLVSLVVALTFIPAALALLGRAAFWPGIGIGETRPEPEPRPSLLIRLRTRRSASLVLAVAALAGLGASAYWMKDTALGFTLIRGQPVDSEVKQAALAAAAGFHHGIIAPTTVLLEGEDLDSPAARAQLVAFEVLLQQRGGVAGVIGPREQTQLEAAPRVFVNGEGTAARLAVIVTQEPLGANAVRIYRDLEGAVPMLAEQAGLDVEVSFAGDTALAAETIDTVRGDVARVAGAVLLANLLLLALFLRALVAPLYLLAASSLGLASSLGITTFVFQHVLGHQDLTYYVPFAAAVLLLSLGSDYNLFVVGRIWQEAERRPLREAIAYAVPRAARTITTAGIILAGSFALLALVPIRPMRELAFAMAVGILIDTFVVRSLLVPSLVVLFGRLGWWPRMQGAPAETRGAAVETAPEAVRK